MNEEATVPPSSDARTWAAIAHASSLIFMVGVPFGNVVGPLVVWLVKRDDDPFIDDQGREAVNFQISVTLYALGLGALFIPLLLVSLFASRLTFGFSVGLLPLVIAAFVAIAVVLVVLSILAAVRARDGEAYRYPLTIRFLR